MSSKQNSLDHGSAPAETIDAVLPDNLQEALVNIFRPIIQELDICVEETRNSQQDLKRQIDILHDEVDEISRICEVSPTLDMYAKKMTTIKRRVTVMHNILQNIQDRLRKLEQTTVVKSPGNASLNVSSTTVPATSLPTSTSPAQP